MGYLRQASKPYASLTFRAQTLSEPVPIYDPRNPETRHRTAFIGEPVISYTESAVLTFWP